jgi:PHD/YefM family antitoxin component YafN of YafNO toxin-antitoxin module
MKSTVSVTEAQKTLPKIMRSEGIVAVTRHDEVAGFFVPRERFEALLETLETLASPQAMRALKRFQAGKMRFKSLAETKREFDASSHV